MIPVVDGWMRLNADENWIFMHDNAPAHKATEVIEDFRERGIIPINWPPFSPDLNPIEHVWKWMKDYIEREYPHNLNQDGLRQAVIAAVPEDFLRKLITSMPERINLVHMTGGG